LATASVEASLGALRIEKVEIELPVSLVTTKDDDAATAWGRFMADAILRAAKQAESMTGPADEAPNTLHSITGGAASGVIQRWTAPFITLKSDEELIASAINDGDVTAIKEISDFNKVQAKDKITMLGMLLTGVVGPRDERAVRQIWASFGDVIGTASANIDLWKRSWERSSDYGRNSLEELAPVPDLKKRFPQDIKAVASNYLQKNRTLVLDELANLGLPSEQGRETPEATADQTLRMAQLQEMLTQVADAQASRTGLLQVYVGYNNVYHPTLGHQRDPLGGGERKVDKPALFNPDFPPQKPPTGNDSVPMKPYQEVKDSYDELTTLITTLASKDPAVY